MGLKIISYANNQDINVLELKDGQLAEITHHSEHIYIGKIVQRYNESLVTIGESSGKCWPNIFLLTEVTQVPSFKVKIIPPGTTFQYVL